MLGWRLREIPCPVGSLLTERDKLTQSDHLWGSRNVRGIQKEQVTHSSQSEIQITLSHCVHKVQTWKPWHAGQLGSEGHSFLPCPIPWYLCNRRLSPKTIWTCLFLAAWKRLTNKAHQSQEITDSSSSAVCWAICKEKCRPFQIKFS